MAAPACTLFLRTLMDAPPMGIIRKSSLPSSLPPPSSHRCHPLPPTLLLINQPASHAGRNSPIHSPARSSVFWAHLFSPASLRPPASPLRRRPPTPCYAVPALLRRRCSVERIGLISQSETGKHFSTIRSELVFFWGVHFHFVSAKIFSGFRSEQLGNFSQLEARVKKLRKTA